MRQKRTFGWVAGPGTLTLAVALGCGRSSLLDTGEEPFAEAGSSAAGSANVGTGGKSSAGSGFGGAPGQAGFFGGGFTSAGFSSAGFPSAGMVNQGCQLAVGDCSRDSEVDCLESHEPCQGALTAQKAFGTNRAFVRDVAVSSTGRVALVGDFVGVLDFGGKSQPLLSVDGATGTSDAFVASFDSQGNAEWTSTFSGNSVDTASGVRFTPSGDLVMQGKSGPMTFVEWLNAQGQTTASNQSRCVSCEPGKVAIDNDGNVVLAGSYEGELIHAGATLNHVGSAGYLIKLNGNGDPMWAQNIAPAPWASTVVTGVAIDDEDNIVVVGNGQQAGKRGAFLRKLNAKGAERFTQELRASVEMAFRAVAVDRKMQIIVAGELKGQMTNEGKNFQSSSNTVPDLWWARYDGNGQLVRQQQYSSSAQGVTVDAATVDPFGNVLLAGSARSLVVDALAPLKESALFVLKLRTDGNGVWLRSFAGAADHATLAADNQGNAWLGGSFKGKVKLGMTEHDAMTNLHGFLLKLSP